MSSTLMQRTEEQKYRYFCSRCQEEFFRPYANINERHNRSCNEFAYIDWGYGLESGSPLVIHRLPKDENGMI